MNYPKTFFDSNEDQITYTNQPITWRISAYAVITTGNKVLLIRGHQEKRWGFPGGGVEPQETLEQACHREVKEEIGAQVKLHTIFHHLESWFYLKEKKTFHHTLRFYYQAELATEIGKPTDKKIKEITWWSWDDVSQDKFQDDVRSAKSLSKHLKL